MLGTIVETVGIGLLAWACWTEKAAHVYGFMALVGVGFGLRYMAGPLHGIGLFRQHRAAIVALLALSIPFGGTIGLTIMTTVFNNTSALDSNEFGDHAAGSSRGGTPDHAIHDAKVCFWPLASRDLVNRRLTISVDGRCLGFCCLGTIRFDSESTVFTNPRCNHIDASLF